MQTALQEAQVQNERLRLTVSAMRSDMESVQQHSSSPAHPPRHTSNTIEPPSAHMQSMQQSQPHNVGQLHQQLPEQLRQQLTQQLPFSHSQQQGQQNGPQEQGLQYSPQSQALQYGAYSTHSQQQQKQEEEVRMLRQQLQNAKCEAQDLAAENERLMELSNALRSERDRAAVMQSVPAQPQQQRQQQQLITAEALDHQGVLQQPSVQVPPAPVGQSYVPRQGSVQHLLSAEVLQPQLWPQPVVPQGQHSMLQPSTSVTYQGPMQQRAGQLATVPGQQGIGALQSHAEEAVPSEVSSIRECVVVVEYNVSWHTNRTDCMRLIISVHT